MIPPWLALSALRKLPWRWIGLAVAILAAVWAVWGAIDRYGDRRAKEAANAVRSEWAAATLAANADIAAKDAAYQRLSGERDAAAAQVTALLTRPPIDPKTLIVRIPTDAPGITCPDRGPEYRLRYNEIATSSGNR